MDLITLADLPALAGSDPKPRSTIVIGRLDSNLRDPRYGKFSITQADVDSWKRNLAGVFGGQVSMDFDHSSDRGNGTRAACWITAINQTGTSEGSLITADAQFTRKGAKAVRDGDYKYTSPTFVENYADEHGVKHGKALIGGALTNRPVLRQGMPTLSLSRDEFPDMALATVSAKTRRKTAAARDSRAQMDLSNVAKLLGLDESADLATVLTGIVTLAGAPAAEPDEEKAARKQAKQARKQAKALARDSQAPTGTVTLSAAELSQLQLDANAGAAAARQLAEQTFTHAWEKALSEGRAAPSQEETMKALYAENSDLAIKTLDSFVQIVPVKAAGAGDHPNTGPAPLGMDEDRFALHTEAKALAAEMARKDPTVDEGEAYALAAIQIQERQFELDNGGF